MGNGGGNGSVLPATSMASRAFGIERSFADGAELDGPVERVAVDGRRDADVQRLAVFHDRPGQFHLVAVDAAFDRRLTVLGNEMPGQARAFLRHVERVLGAA